ncbi:MAG: hypothetical protein HY843_08020, partial [Bdellovibrio sp.]|nr:hypothetical protein [Bdellovibrio sp.]
MIRKIERPYFEVWGNAESQNLILKWLLLIFCSVILIESISLVILGLRKPVLIAIGEENTAVFKVKSTTQETLEREAKRTLSGYIQNHYTWDSKNIDEHFAIAAHYVFEKQIQNFKLANAEQIRSAKERKLSQRVHVSELLIDMQVKAARVTMDRILDVEGIRAVTPLILDLSFDFGQRTKDNPEGIYVISERNIT